MATTMMRATSSLAENLMIINPAGNVSGTSTRTIVRGVEQSQNPHGSLVELGKQLLAASKDGYANEVSTLLTKGAPMTTDWLGTSPLHLAAQHGHQDIAEILMRSGCSKDAKTKVDKTPLHLAATEGHPDLMEVLLKAGAEVDSKDMLKMTPLHWAVQRGHDECVEVLLRYGADVEIENKFGKGPMEIASGQNRHDTCELLQNAEQIRATAIIDPMESDPQTAAATKSITDDLQSQNDLEQLSMDVSQNATAQAENQEDAVKLLAAHGITFLPEDDGGTSATGMVASGQTLTLTEAGKLALNKFPIRKLSASPTKVLGGLRTVQLKSANIPVTKPVKIVTINTSTASRLTVPQKIQSKPIVINAPYAVPQTQKVIRIQSAEGGEKKRIIKLTAEQFAAIKSGAKLQGIQTGSVATGSKPAQPLFTLTPDGVRRIVTTTNVTTATPSNTTTLFQQHPSVKKPTTVKIVRINPGSISSGVVSSSQHSSPLKTGAISIVPKVVTTAAENNTTSSILATTSLEEASEDESKQDTGSKEDPKAALKRKLQEIETMNEELRRRQEEAEELKRQLEEEDGT